MSRKANRLRNRVRIEQERAARVSRDAAAERARVARLDATLARRRDQIEAAAANLDRSVALRIRVERDFARPMGPQYGLNLVFFPEEFKYAAMSSRGGCYPMNQSFFAEQKGHEVGQQVAAVILRCLRGELEEFTKAK